MRTGIGRAGRLAQGLATGRRYLDENLIRCPVKLIVVGAQVFGLLSQLLCFIESSIAQQADGLVHQELREVVRVHGCVRPGSGPLREHRCLADERLDLVG